MFGYLITVHYYCIIQLHAMCDSNLLPMTIGWTMYWYLIVEIYCANQLHKKTYSWKNSRIYWNFPFMACFDYQWFTFNEL